MKKKRILFVCLGNHCRSPAGEAFMKHLVNQRDASSTVEVDSAGTAGYFVNQPADPRMCSAAASRGVQIDMLGRQVTAADFDRFDLIVAMDRENEADLHAIASTNHDRIVLLSKYLDDSWPIDVPDPYYGDGSMFEAALDMIEAACPSILDQLLVIED
ncbi:MAG: low molecular weight protein-tyrosine-phosphatase [Pirellulaceae bacterium]